MQYAPPIVLLSFFIIKMPGEEYKLKECASISRTCHPPHLRWYVTNVPSNYTASHATRPHSKYSWPRKPKDWWNHKCQYRKGNVAIDNCGNSSSDATTNWSVTLYQIFKAQWSLYVRPGLTFTKSTFCPHSVFTCFVWIWGKKTIISLTLLTGWFFCKRDLTL